MIDTFDPNLNLPQPPASTVQPVEPVESETVSVRGDHLDNKKSQEEPSKRRKKRDRVEVHGLETEETQEEETLEEHPEASSEDSDGHQIDIII
ncbi:MAG: hypothetical protein V3R68_04520 [Gammaproteobacteria bacterium]